MSELSRDPRQFYEKGYSVATHVLSKSTTREIRQGIDTQIELCVKQLGCSRESYLGAVSRWADPSPVTAAIPCYVLETLIQTARAFIKKPVSLKKMNIICKNAYCRGSVPYHQDISYSPEDPYEFSMWVALDDVSKGSGPLEVIPESHLFPIEPAVDFWSPLYEPNDSLTSCAKKLILTAGDGVFFDSRLWHGSGENKESSSRYALVVRFVSDGWIPDQPIPPIRPNFFGLWTSGKMTEDLLQKGLRIIFNEVESDFIKLIEIWMCHIQEKSLPFLCDAERALECLRALKIIHLAHTAHNGGDAPGTIYKTCWATFLSPLNDYVVGEQNKGNL